MNYNLTPLLDAIGRSRFPDWDRLHSVVKSDLRTKVLETLIPGLPELDNLLAQAWDMGMVTALNFATRNDDGITLSLDQPNPYRS